MLEIVIPPAWRTSVVADGGVFRLDQLGGGDDVGGRLSASRFRRCSQWIFPQYQKGGVRELDGSSRHGKGRD